MYDRPTRVLVVDDEPGVRELLCTVLAQAGYGVDQVATGFDAIARLEAHAYGVVVTDYSMPGMNGLQLLSILQDRWPDTVVIFVSADLSGIGSRAMRQGAYAWLPKPVDWEQLISTVSQGMHAMSACAKDAPSMMKPSA